MLRSVGRYLVTDVSGTLLANY